MNKIRAFLPTLFLAVLTSFLIFSLYNSQNIKEDITLLDAEENNILNRCGRSAEKFRFCSYPKSDSNSQVITWDKNNDPSGNKSLILVFKNDNIRRYLGIHLYLTLNLAPYLENGCLEFWLKGKESYPLTKNLVVHLKEEPIIQRIVGISLPVRINENWQKFSLPINKFLLIKRNGTSFKNEDKGFTWEIQEVLFSIDPLNLNESIELFINDLRIISDHNVTYEFF